MRKLMIVGGLAILLAMPLLAMPDTADAASCRSRKTTGTVLGGLGGALLGSAVGGTGATIVGGAGGAVVGHEVGRSGCKRRVAYRSYSRAASPAPAAPRAARTTYYDQYGQPVGAVTPDRVSYSGAAACRTVTQSYYDDRGLLVRRPVQVCDR